MADIWKVLGIEKTTDKKLIKKAYHKKLRSTNPEKNQSGFMRLREAYEQAIEGAEQLEEGFRQSVFLEDFYEAEVSTEEAKEEEDDYEDELYFLETEKQRKEFALWWERFCEMYQDVRTRWDSGCWYALLYEDIPYQMGYYKECRSRIYDILFDTYRESYLPQEVWHVIDGFFSYSETMVKRTVYQDSKLNAVNRKVKLNELFDFAKFDLEGNLEYIDDFCHKYAALIDLLPEASKKKQGKKIEALFKELESYDVFYLPFASLNLAYHFQGHSNENIEAQIQKMEGQFGNVTDIRLLKAEYALYQKDSMQAEKLLGALYKEVPFKDFVQIYQLAVCCQLAGLDYEAWMLYKMLTRLNPKPFMFRRAKEVYREAFAEPEKHRQGLLGGPELLEEREQKAAILYKEQKYKEAIDCCNELLEEYPLSYPVLLLRAYADWNYLRVDKRYTDINRLIEVNPDGIGARLLSVSILLKGEKYDDAIEVLKPVEERCFPQMEYLRIKKIENKDYREYRQRLIAFFQKSMEGELPIEPKSSHHLLDMEKIFFEVVYMIKFSRTREEVNEIISLCNELKISKYNHPNQYMDWFSVYIMAKMYDEAYALREEELEKETDVDERNEIMVDQFIACYWAKRYSRALEILPYIVNEECGDRVASLMGDVYEWAGKQEEAKRCFEREIKCDGDFNSYLALARYYYRSNQWENAIATAEEGLIICGKTGKAYLELFCLYSDMGYYDKALECVPLMKRYAKEDHIKRRYHFCMGYAYMVKKEYAKALEYFEQSEKEQCLISACGNMAICNQGLNRYKEAIALYEKQLARQKEPSIIHLCIIQHCYFLMDGHTDHELAMRIQKEIEKQTDSETDRLRELYCYLSDVMAAMGHVEQAEAYLEQAECEKLCPGCSKCHEILWGKAWLCTYQGKYRKAVAYFEQALEIEDDEQVMHIEYIAVKKLADAIS
ncbi:MAG: tetratricopeptide repeat protein [Lachnospiraceae bacterium]|nr:tetratricopeptide repeat protein [Lachnospiraceae bacterium]